jgi:hypothetical protein
VFQVFLRNPTLIDLWWIEFRAPVDNPKSLLTFRSVGFNDNILTLRKLVKAEVGPATLFRLRGAGAGAGTGDAGAGCSVPAGGWSTGASAATGACAGAACDTVDLLAMVCTATDYPIVEGYVQKLNGRCFGDGDDSTLRTCYSLGVAIGGCKLELITIKIRVDASS